MKKRIIILLVIISIITFTSLYFKDKGKSNNLAVYIDDKLETSIPKKGKALFKKAICDDSVNISWDNDSWALLITNLNRKIKCNLYFYSGETTYNFDYTSGEQTFKVPISGIYKLETWGAAGGDANTYNLTATGGYGSYSIGNISLNKDDILYINVGEKGTNTSLDFTTSSAVSGSKAAYNGGSYEAANTDTKWAGGGGATHIALKSGLLSSLENVKDKLLIVSGSGGGAAVFRDTANNGGSGGGYIGNSGTGSDIATGGTQTSGGTADSFKWDTSTIKIASSFGVGASFGSGGGSGYYGGGSGWSNGSSAGGGSGYIGNSSLTNKVMYCYNCSESSEENIKTISTTCSSETPTENCSKKGNGYARITLVSVSE